MLTLARQFRSLFRKDDGRLPLPQAIFRQSSKNYSGLIFEKRRLLESISAHFGWPIDSQGIGLILEWADVVPAEERPTEFIRRVHPGDHKNKLSDNAIGQLNKILAEPLRAFGYVS